MFRMTLAVASGLGALSLLLYTGCVRGEGSDVGTSSSAVAGSASLDGFTTAGAVSAQNSTDWSTYQYNTTYRVENNEWGIPQNGQGTSTIFLETLNGAQAFGWAWNVYDGTGVVIYPEVGYGWSPNANASWGGNPTIPQISQQQTISANFNIIGQHSSNSSWDMAYDIWITSSARPANTVGSFELMIWLDHNIVDAWNTQGPQGEVNIDGVNYQRYTNAGAADWTCLSYVNQGAGIYSGTNFNISDVINDAAAKFGIPSSYYVAAIEFGNEAINGSGMTEISNWAINIGSAAPPPPPPTTTALPGQVQASDYTALTGTLKLESCSDVGGGEDLGYTSVGATAQYQVSVATAGSFNAAYRVAALQGGSFDVLIDGNKVDTITVGATGGWQSWTTVNGNSAYAIGAGTHTLQIKVDATAYNLNWIDFASTTASTTALPGQVQASDYTALTGTLKLESCSDVGGGEDLGYTSVGATAQYQVSVATAGSFSAAYRVAALQGGSFDVLIDGNKVDTITVGATGGWQSWTTVNGNSAYAVGAGTHALQIKVDTTAYNLNWVDFTQGGSCGSAGGSYAETCSNCSVAGTTLTCDCLNESQASVSTSINLCTCPQPPVISNANGVLSCP